MPSAIAPAAAPGLPPSTATNSTPPSLAYLGRAHAATLIAWKDAREAMHTLSGAADIHCGSSGLLLLQHPDNLLFRKS